MAALIELSDTNLICAGLWFKDAQGVPNAELYASLLRLEMAYARRGITDVLAPAGTVTTTRPTVYWETYAPDSDLGDQAGWIIRVYDSATFSAPGFNPWNPAAWRPVWQGGDRINTTHDLNDLATWIAGSGSFARDTAVRAKKVQADDQGQFFVGSHLEVGVTYRAYVWVAQAWAGHSVHGPGGWWSDLAYVEFTVVPAVGPNPSLQLFADVDGQMVAVRLTAPSTSDPLWPAIAAITPNAAWYEVQHQHSDGRWETIRLINGEMDSDALLAGNGGVEVFMDYEPPTGPAVPYRVRALWEAGDGSQGASAWVTGTVALEPEHWILRIPEHPTVWTRARLAEDSWKYTSSGRTTVKQPIGRKLAVVIGGGVTGEAFSVSLSFPDDGEFQAFEAVRDMERLTYFAGPRDQHYYVRMTDSRDVTQTVDGGDGGIWRVVAVTAAEQDKPDPGVVGALTAGEFMNVAADALRVSGS